MATTIDALQGLYVARGGDISDVEDINTIPDMIDAIASVTEASTDGSVPITADEVDEIIGSVK